MTKRSPRRKENRIPTEQTERIRFAAEVNPVQKPVQRPVQEPVRKPVQRPLPKTTGESEKPPLHIVEPLFWEEDDLNPAPLKRPRNAVTNRPATYAPEPELQADMLHKQPKLSPEEQMRKKQRAREEQLRRPEQNRASAQALRTDMPMRGSGQEGKPLQPAAPAPQQMQRPLQPAARTYPLPEKELAVVRRTPVSRSSKKVFSKAFKRGFFISWGIFIVLLLAALALLWVRMGNYEKGLPDHTIEAVCGEIGKGNLSGLHMEAADGRALKDKGLFVDEASISAVLQKKNQENPLSYVIVNAESSEDQNVYLIRSGDQELLKVCLDGAAKGEGWKETKTVLSGEAFAIKQLSAQIPSDGTLLLGETEIPRSYVTEERAQISILSKLVDQGFLKDAPTLDTYTVEGIFPEAPVSMKTKDGKTVSCSKTEDVYIAGFEADEAFEEEQKDRVLSMFEPYAAYFSGDAGKGVLKKIMLDDSPAYESASSADVSWMQDHDDVQLSEQRVENFRKYTDDCYSCDIHFLEDIYQNGEVVRTWDTNMTWILIQDGDYYIADFVTKAES